MDDLTRKYQNKKRHEKKVLIDNILSVVAAGLVVASGIHMEIPLIIALAGGIITGGALKYVYGEPKERFEEEELVNKTKKKCSKKSTTKEAEQDQGVTPIEHRRLSKTMKVRQFD